MIAERGRKVNQGNPYLGWGISLRAGNAQGIEPAPLMAICSACRMYRLLYRFWVIQRYPELPGVQGTLPRFAVEGLANGELAGGVEFSVYLPMYVPFLGSDLMYPPLLQTKP
jgi:hypothetical protein